MPIPAELQALSSSLSTVFDASFTARTSDSWGNPRAMSMALAGVKRRFDSPLITSNRQSVTMAITRYRRSGLLKSFLEIKYVCIGACEDFSGWRLLQDAALLNTLLKTAQQGSDRARMKCVACLLRGYWSFPRHVESTSELSQKGWITLRTWLAGQVRALNSSGISKPLWFQTLCRNSNLLGEEPCKPYQKELLQGTSQRLNEAYVDLGIPADSWLREEAVLSQVKAGTCLNDNGFKACISNLLTIVSGETEFKLSRQLSIRCISALVSRYATCTEKPEHIGLRDSAIDFIGNPWLHRAAWDSCVLNIDGTPDVEARQMLNAWLKIRLIKDFFDLLSEDNAADGRRLNYWLRFEPLIDDMWFVLGDVAMSDMRKEYVEFRQRAKGRILYLVGTTPPENNAFLMRIGEYLVVEFGKVNNACFVYEHGTLRADLKRKLLSQEFRASIDIADLKVSRHKNKFSHLGTWEPIFDYKICPILGVTPPSSRKTSVPSRIPFPPKVVVVAPGVTGSISLPRTLGRGGRFNELEFRWFLTRNHLENDDLRTKGGCLWVRTNDSNAKLCEDLKFYGFAYKPGKGWWRE